MYSTGLESSTDNSDDGSRKETDDSAISISDDGTSICANSSSRTERSHDGASLGGRRIVEITKESGLDETTVRLGLVGLAGQGLV